MFFVQNIAPLFFSFLLSFLKVFYYLVKTIKIFADLFMQRFLFRLKLFYFFKKP